MACADEHDMQANQAASIHMEVAPRSTCMLNMDDAAWISMGMCHNVRRAPKARFDHTIYIMPIYDHHAPCSVNNLLHAAMGTKLHAQIAHIRCMF